MENIELLFAGIIISAIGFLNLFFSIKFLRNPNYARNYITKSPKAFLWRKIFGEERAYKITKNVFLPLGITIGVLMILVGIFFFILYINLQLTYNVNTETESNLEADSPDVFYLQSNDSNFLKAKEQAQSEIIEFIDSLSINFDYAHGVKTSFKEGENVEHMWVYVYSYSNNEFSGVLVNEPEVITNYNEGDNVTVLKQDVEDWAIFDENENLIDGDFLAHLLIN